VRSLPTNELTKKEEQVHENIVNQTWMK